MISVQPIPVGSLLVDTVTPLGLAQLRALRDEGVDGVICYLGGNLTPDLILNAGTLGMGVVPVNFAHEEGWTPTAALGEADAEASIRRLTVLGVPTQGLVDWCDVEGCASDPTAYCQAWCARLTTDGAGRVPGGYEGSGARLNAAQWYELPFLGYWKSGSSGVPEPECGWMMMQLYPLDTTCAGLRIDYDVVQRDFKGRAPTWLFIT